MDESEFQAVYQKVASVWTTTSCTVTDGFQIYAQAKYDNSKSNPRPEICHLGASELYFILKVRIRCTKNSLMEHRIMHELSSLSLFLCFIGHDPDDPT